MLLGVLYHYHPIAKVLGIELTVARRPYYRVLGWRELGPRCPGSGRTYPQAVLLSNSRKHLAYLSYYAVPRDMHVAARGIPAGGIPPTTTSWSPTSRAATRTSSCSSVVRTGSGRTGDVRSTRYWERHVPVFRTWSSTCGPPARVQGLQPLAQRAALPGAGMAAEFS